jgi:MFS family permease
VERYQRNVTWLTCSAPLRNLGISAAYLTPFFLAHGLDLSKVFLLQSIYSVAALLWEIPSGLIADRIGRAFSIKLSVPIATIALISYGFSTQYWQFVVCELVLAIANGLVSGIDTALLYDSLKADGNEKKFVKVSQRINVFSFIATALGVPIAWVLVNNISISSTLVADGVLTGVGAIFAMKLVEAPRSNGSQEAVRLSAWHAIKQLGSNIEARWLVLLGTTLATATYMAFWLSAPYYTHLGISAEWFSVILAGRSLWKALLSHKISQERHLERNMFVYATLVVLVYLGMATSQLWLVWVVLGHDAVQALQSQPITDKLNAHMTHEFRATMNSLVNLVQRLGYSLTGPLIGLLVDATNLGTGFTVTGIVCSALAFLALVRLHKLKTFQERR